MAEIYGVKITNLKTFMGMEGCAAQGNVRAGNKLLGFWSQDGNGGCDRYDFDVTLLRDAAEKHFAAQPEDWEHRHLYIDKNGAMKEEYVDVLMYELSNLTESEKEWKKMAKKGYPIMVQYHSTPDPAYPNAVPLTQVIFVNQKYMDASEEDILVLVEKDTKQSDLVIEVIRKKPEDFIIR